MLRERSVLHESHSLVHSEGLRTSDSVGSLYSLQTKQVSMHADTPENCFG